MADTLTRYPRPNVAVDLALLTVLPEDDREPARLAVLMQHPPTDTTALALPGRFLRDRQRAVAGMADVLKEKVGIDVVPTRPLLLGVFDAPDRDPRAWTISLAHALALPYEELAAAHGELIPVDLQGRIRTRRKLLFDHAEMVSQAASAIRDRYERRPDPDGLLTGPFTLTELRRVHEGVLGEPLLRDTFNRRMTDHLEKLTGEQRSDGGRPAQLFRSPTAASRMTASDRRRLTLPRLVAGRE